MLYISGETVKAHLKNKCAFYELNPRCLNMGKEQVLLMSNISLSLLRTLTFRDMC